MNTYNVLGQGQSIDVTHTFSVLMRNVFTTMACGLLTTALTAFAVAHSELILYTIATTPLLMWGLFISEFVLVWYLSSRIMKLSFLTAGIMFVIYSILNGITLSFIFVAYTAESIAQTFFITAGTFGAMSLVGYTIKKDLSDYGRILYMCLIGFVIATLVNWLFASSMFAMILNYIGLLLFVGLTVYDTQKIKNMLLAYSDAGITDQTNKLALLGSLSLYLDFVNLFLFILRLLGDRK